MSKKNLVLGFELSTQSAKWIVLDTEAGHIVHTGDFEFDTVFSNYGTRGGVLESEDPQLRHAPPSLYLDALDRIFDTLNTEGVDLSRLAAVKCDGHQHCTIYTDESLATRLVGLAGPATARGGDSLTARLAPAFTRETVPIWEDRTTESQAAALTEALADYRDERSKPGSPGKPAAAGGGGAPRAADTPGGAGKPGAAGSGGAGNPRAAGAGGSPAGAVTGIEALTGNRAELRFPASQIIRWAKADPEAYERTAHIQLLSAFLTSVLSGHIAPVDTGDGWGTNLNHTNIDYPGFSPTAVEATAGLAGESGPERLRSQIGEMVAYDTPVGTVSPYFVRRYGVSGDAVVLAATGDNPATLLGVGDGALVSMGSSYTVCGPMREVTPSPDGNYNVFGYRPGYAMALTVITNGGKLHREFCDLYARGDWSAYAELTGPREISPDEEPIMLPYLTDESVPVAPAGIVREGFEEGEAAANVRALHLSQVASMRLHSSHLSDVDRVNVVGGGAVNAFLRQAIADAFGATVTVAEHAESAAPFGCALSAARFALDCSYEEVVRRFAGGTEETKPEPSATAEWDRLVERFAKLEAGRR